MYAEGSYLNLLFGVSQQAAQDRLPGQLETQINMVSDLVAGLRRRPGAQLVGFVAPTNSGIEKIKVYNTTVAGQAVVVLVDTGVGKLYVCDERTGATLFSATNSYLTTPEASDIRMITIDDAVWVCNVDVLPTLATDPVAATYPNPAHYGYFYIASGGYSKTYDLTITDQNTALTNTVSYTTPDGSLPAHAAQSTPEYIATQLQNAANAAWPGAGFTGASVGRDGAYCVVNAPSNTITISSSSGSLYIRCSNAMSIRDVAELPAKLPASGNGLIVATGAGNVKVYYRYDNNRKVWVEEASWDSLQVPQNMPLRLKFSAGWTLVAPAYERRASGNKETNPNMRIFTDGITGMAAFQGRIALLSNEYVCMSASNNPLRYYRSTMSQLADDDPIEVAAQGTLTAPYEHAVSFNKDLLLFSRHYQGVVPGSAMVTPRTANCAVMTRYDVDTLAQPAVAGRSVFFAAPRAPGWNGMHEMVPSGFGDSLYVADDVTRHIPRMIPADARFISASSTANLLIYGSTASAQELVIHEYQWSSGEKVHHSWHNWNFAHPIVAAYFSGDSLMMVVMVPTPAGSATHELTLLNVDMQRGAGPDSNKVPRFDYWEQRTCTVAGQLQCSDALPAMGDTPSTHKVWAFKIAGTLPGMFQEQLCTVAGGGVPGSPGTVTVLDAAVGDVFVLGKHYLSTVVPTPPVIKDQKDVPVTTSRAIIHRYRVGMYNTGEFTYRVSDQAHDESVPVTTTPVRLFSTPLNSGLPLTDTAVVTIPARMDLRTVELRLTCDGPYDMNILSMEYGYKFNQRYRRV